MSLVIPTSDGPLEISAHQLQAVVSNAQRRAALTAAVLDATGIFKSEPCRLPAAFLLELSAVCELGLWERQGLRVYLDTDLPTFREAAAELSRRADKGLAEFEGPDAARLSQRVLRVWMQHFAWDGPQRLGCDTLVGAVDEDEFAAVLAEFLLEHRHDLSNLVSNQEGNP